MSESEEPALDSSSSSKAMGKGLMTDEVAGGEGSL